MMSHLVITTLCNDNCISCVNEFKNRKAVHSLKFYKGREKYISSSNHISIGGGEPTLHPEFFDILLWVHNMGKEMTLLSNVRSFSNDAFFHKFNGLVLDKNRLRIATSLYGYDAKTHDSISRCPGGFKQKVKAIKRFLENGYKVELRVVLSKLNYKLAKNIASFILVNFKGLERVVFVSAKYTGEAKNNSKVTLVPIKNTISFLLPACDMLLDEGETVHLLHYPHCVIPEKYWKCTRGQTAEETEICFIKECKDCKVKKECSGIWRSYIKLQGKEEFKKIS